MKKIIIISIALLALTACESKQVEEVKASSNQSYPVEKLFTVDGITVYRFRDNDRYVYFTNRIETIGVKQITKEALKELTEQASELLKYKVECIRESIKREPFPPYKERLHPRKHWQRKPYWLRTRSNPKKKGYH